MNEDDIALFNDSFERCMSAPEFFDLFYDDFLRRSPEAREKFAGTDFRRQKKALRKSLYATMFATGGRREDLSFLDPIADRHSRDQLDIRPGLYGTWLDCMIATVSRCDPYFSADVERVWRRVLERAVAHMLARY